MPLPCAAKFLLRRISFLLEYESPLSSLDYGLAAMRI
jgi:hypothetical protein